MFVLIPSTHAIAFVGLNASLFVLRPLCLRSGISFHARLLCEFQNCVRATEKMVLSLAQRFMKIKQDGLYEEIFEIYQIPKTLNIFIYVAST